jgi:AcrR family transcriptional regulator
MPKVSPTYLEQRRDEILDAAWACFARKGYHDTTMQDIFAESGLSAGAVYRYFTGKEEILGAISERALKVGRAVVDAAQVAEHDPLGALNAVGQIMLAAFTNPDFAEISRVNITLWPEIIRADALRDAWRRDVTFWLDTLTGLFRQAKDEGHLAAGVEPEAAAAALVCTYEGLRLFRAIAPERFTPEILVQLGAALAGAPVPKAARHSGAKQGQARGEFRPRT